MHADERPWLVTYHSPIQTLIVDGVVAVRQMVVKAINRSHAYEVFKKRCPLADVVEVN